VSDKTGNLYLVKRGDKRRWKNEWTLWRINEND
jgi:hypothetical protein